MLLGAVGLLVWSSAWFPGLYFGLLALQVGLLLASLDQPPRWGRTWRGLLLLGGLGLGVDFLLRALGLPLPSRAGHLVALGLGVLLGGGVVRWLYPRLAPKGPVRALAVVLPLLALTNSGLLFLATQERLDRLVLGFLLQVISAGPLLAFYLEALQHQRRSASIESVYAALLDTVAALPHRSEAELWSRLLASAVQVVPGAQAGSIRLRQGADFVFVAQQGFDEGVLGLRSSAHEAMAWHGDPLQWRRGQPRIANHADLQRIWATQAANCRLYERLNRASHQRIQQIRSTLCVPIPLGDEVMAEINLDAFHDRAFDHRSIEVARQYAQQVRALLAVHRQQSELEARVRELEVIEALSGALRGLKGTSEITRRLVYETIRLMNSEHAALLLLDPDGEQQRCYAAAGMFLEIKDTLVPRGWGLGWAAIETRAPIWLDQAHLDQRAYGQFRHPPEAYSEIVIPLLNSQGQPLGVLISARNGERAYLERDVRLLQIIGNIAANTLERVRANESLEAEIAEKTALLELSQMLGATMRPCCLRRWRKFARWVTPTRSPWGCRSRMDTTCAG
ncbi:GAF domain-containing protein [Meiothermus ruber]|uniref:GAF domain-containing protein n=1 Tax=Meiothermus ruber TaxID=277 RepID=UPI001F4D0C88|nr:GAF domain-containing protein [Meiothermus ruber]